ncbi:DUF6923 family protein [Crenothrix polyspora]|nr:GEVED domain-containing protein [Crenothrix polyspora]
MYDPNTTGGDSGYNGWIQPYAVKPIGTLVYKTLAKTARSLDISVLGWGNASAITDGIGDDAGYIGTKYLASDWDRSVEFTHKIAAIEAGNYSFNLKAGDDHVKIYKNGILIYSIKDAYAQTNTAPVLIFPSYALASGDVLTVVIIEEHQGNTALNIEITPLFPSPCTLDYGDAPATYGRPTHSIPVLPTLYLGNVAPDSELSAATPLIGTGDDATGTDDEDGITLPANLMIGSKITLPVIVKGTGYLNAWFDWNADGDFADPGEQLLPIDQNVVAGTTQLSVDVPATAVAGVSYARFRLCSTLSSCNTPTGNASSGEVEDYQITISKGFAGTPYTCDGYFYQIRRVSNGPSRLFRIDRLNPSAYAQTELLDLSPYTLNALALNKQDGYFYALTQPTSAALQPTLIKIGQSGTEVLGTVSVLPNTNYVAGTFDSAGNYYVSSGNTLYKINISTQTSTAITLSGSTLSPGDMAVNPNESGVIYAANVSSLYRIVVSGTST